MNPDPEHDTTGPRCDCGNPVDPALLEIRELLPALSPDLCTACHAAAEAESEAIGKAEAQETIQRERAARLSIIPPEILETDTGHVAFNVPLWDQVRHWHPSCGRWLLIQGLPGRCKTRVVGLLAKQLILEGYRVAWAPACDIAGTVQDTASFDRSLWEPARETLRRLKSAGVLIIDDIGKNPWTPQLEAVLFSIIDHRKTWKLPTVLTCNEPLAEMLRDRKISADRGAPIVSRVLEASRGWHFEAPEIQPRTTAGRGAAA